MSAADAAATVASAAATVADAVAATEKPRAAGEPSVEPGGDAELPHGRSRWDRLPREMKHAIIESSGPLTKFTTGYLPWSEVNTLHEVDHEQMWRDMLETGLTDCFDMIPVLVEPLKDWEFAKLRGRALFDRFAELDIPRMRRSLQVAAAVNGWLDELAWDRPKPLSMVAATAGAMPVLLALVDGCGCPLADTPAAAAGDGGGCPFWRTHGQPRVGLTAEHAEQAAMGGHVEVVQLVHQRLGTGRSWGTHVADYAAANGHERVLAWLRAERPNASQCSRAGANGAAANGHVHILRSLAEHQLWLFKPDIVPDAARAASVASLDFLVNNMDVKARVFPCGAQALTSALSCAMLFKRPPCLLWLLIGLEEAVAMLPEAAGTFEPEELQRWLPVLESFQEYFERTQHPEFEAKLAASVQIVTRTISSAIEQRTAAAQAGGDSEDDGGAEGSGEDDDGEGNEGDESDDMGDESEREPLLHDEDEDGGDDGEHQHT
ncbi:hypothetical protein HK105_206868 [Polyrhizophydium stewartii]|uniref:Ankyrin repeat protein n=1 Tax=Polyrhizophydium stewartii TaxID=2732419 RepID=A0ABR4N210_9FUNG